MVNYLTCLCLPRSEYIYQLQNYHLGWLIGPAIGILGTLADTAIAVLILAARQAARNAETA